MTLPQDRSRRSARRVLPGGTALLLSTAVHAAVLPLAGLLWTSSPSVAPPADSIQVTLAWEPSPPPGENAPAEPPRAATPPTAPPTTPAIAKPATPVARRLTHAASHVIDTSAPQQSPAENATAAGAGAGAEVAEPPQQAALPPPPKAEVLARYSRQLLGRLENFKTYPALSQRRGEEGTILLRLTLAEDGRLISAEPLGDGAARLVQASLTAVQAASPFPPIPEELNSRQLVFDLPVSYRLR
ncbi:MAG TPA: TonB family protein [Rhodospirillaceae bacterium]|nr:TonB family protein [Rhodospirillaceae bacterium]